MMGSLAILVSSYDAYSDLWPPYFAAFQRNWPDCPYPVYLLSNYKTFPDPAVKSIRVGSVKAWPESIRLALNQIPEDFVLLLLEDLFIVSRMDTKRFEQLNTWIAEQRPACIRLQPDRGMVPTRFPGICMLPPGTPYRSSTVISLWRKDVLLDVLRPGESIWEFEVVGSQRTDKYPDFYVTEQSYVRYIHGVIRGKWVPRAQKQLIAAGYPVQKQARPVFALSDRIVQWARVLRSRALEKIPIWYQRRIRLRFSTTTRSAGGQK
jgi:hypothetical protein